MLESAIKFFTGPVFAPFGKNNGSLRNESKKLYIDTWKNMQWLRALVGSDGKLKSEIDEGSKASMFSHFQTAGKKQCVDDLTNSLVVTECVRELGYEIQSGIKKIRKSFKTNGYEIGFGDQVRTLDLSALEDELDKVKDRCSEYLESVFLEVQEDADKSQDE